MYYSHPLYVEDIKKISDYTFPWEKLENKKILITGASGMIGTVLVDVLMEHNRTYDSKIHVFAMGRSEQRARERFKNYMEDSNFSFIQGDINNSLQLDTKMDYLFSLRLLLVQMLSLHKKPKIICFIKNCFFLF